MPRRARSLAIQQRSAAAAAAPPRIHSSSLTQFRGSLPSCRTVPSSGRAQSLCIHFVGMARSVGRFEGATESKCQQRSGFVSTADACLGKIAIKKALQSRLSVWCAHTHTYSRTTTVARRKCHHRLRVWKSKQAVGGEQDGDKAYRFPSPSPGANEFIFVYIFVASLFFVAAVVAAADVKCALHVDFDF